MTLFDDQLVEINLDDSYVQQARNDFGVVDDSTGEHPALWEMVQQARSYMTLSGVPNKINDFYDFDPTKRPKPLYETTGAYEDALRQSQALGQNTRQSYLVSQLQDVAAENEGTVPEHWYFQWHEDDIAMLRDSGAVDIDMEWWMRAQAAFATEAEFQREYEREVDKRFEAAQRGEVVRRWFDPSSYLAAGQFATQPRSVDREKIEEEVWLEYTGRRDQIYEDEFEKWRERRRPELIDIATEGAAKRELEIIYQELLDAAEAEGKTIDHVVKINARQEARKIQDGGRVGDPGSFFAPDGKQENAPDHLAKDWIAEQLALEEDSYRRMIVSGADPGDLLDTRSGFSNVVHGGLGGFYKGMDYGFTGVGNVMNFVPGTGPVSEWMENRYEAEHQEEIAELEEYSARPDADIINDIAVRGARLVWEEMETTNPEMKEGYILASGDNPALAFGLFAADMQDSKEVQEQLRIILEDTRKADEQMLVDLREQDFRFSSAILDVLASWGRIVDRPATAFTLLLTDKDYRDSITTQNFSGGWKQLFRDADKLGTPSAAVGLDGTLVGLGMDILLGTGFDPTIFFFGPKFLGAKKGAAVATEAQAQRLTRSAPVRAMIDDGINISQSPSRGIIAFDLATSWLPFTHRAKLRELVGWTTNKLNGKPVWKTHATGQGAMEVGVEFLDGLLDDAQRAALDADGAAKLAADITENNFQEAVTMVYSRADDTIHLEDGAKRVLAAQAGDISRVPARLKIVDKAADGTTVLKGFDEAEGAIIREVAEGRAVARTEGQVIKEGSDLQTRTNLFNTTRQLREIANSVPVGTVRTKSGLHAKVEKFVTSGGQAHYYLLNDADEIVGAVVGKGGRVTGVEGGLNVALADDFRGVMDQVWDLARKQGDEFILQVGRSGSMSTDMNKFATKYAKKLLEDAAEQLPTKGRKLEDLGITKKSALKDAAEGAGETITRPDSLIPGENLLGKVDKAALEEVVHDAILNYGAKPSDGARAVAHSSLRGRLKEALKSQFPVIERWLTPMNTTTQMGLHHPGALDDIMDMIRKIYGDDIATADVWAQKVYDAQAEAVRIAADNTAKLDALTPVRKELQELRDLHGGDGPIAMAQKLSKKKDLTPDDQLTLAMAKKNASKEAEITKRLEKETLKVQKSMESMSHEAQLVDLVQGIYEAFNAKYIVPRWKNQIKKNPDIFDAEKGIVKWEELRKGKLKSPTQEFSFDDSWLPTELRNQGESVGMSADEIEKLGSFLHNVKDTPMNVNLPISPLELMAASSVGGSKYIRFTHNAQVATVRELALTLHKTWIIDKVIRPATAFTVSVDELLRILHEGGRWALKRYVEDRGLFLNGRIQHALRGGLDDTAGFSPVGRFLERDAVKKGARFSPRLENRLRELDEWSLKSRQFERTFYDDHGLGWEDIQRDNPIYRDASKRWFGGMLQDTGFRAYLRGPEAFREWFYSVDGQRMRDATVLQQTPFGPRTTVASSADQAYQGWQTVFEKVILQRARKQGVHTQMMDQFRRTAKAIDDAGGKPIDLPDWVFQHTGAVRGIKKHSRRGFSPLRLTDGFFDRFFLDPVNYRRGFVADMVAQQELTRIRTLAASRGKRILTDFELEEALGVKGLALANRTGVGDLIDKLAAERGFITERQVHRMVQRSVDKEIDHMLYVADRGSRAGELARKTVFPFGQPHADMLGFWGREMLRRPHFRGQINEKNFLRIPELLSDKSAWLPNPRTPALLSRLANTDFTIDQGIYGEAEEGEQRGVLPGSEQSDFSPLLFLPTGGENPFWSLIPGAGYIPMWGLDMLLANMHDPIEEPVEYQNLISQIGEFMPGALFGNPDPAKSIAQRFLGGGTFGQALEGIMDAYAIFQGSGAGYGPVSTWLGQPDREIDRGRQLSALLTDPEEWEDLFALTTGEDVALYFDTLAMESDRRAAVGNLQENLSRGVFPAGQKFSGELDELKQVWLDAADQFSFLGTPGYEDQTATPATRTQEAGEIRDRFFDLDPEERDLLVAQFPMLAVNMISSWDWTDNAWSRGIPDSPAYRTDGSREGLARHQQYIDLGYIRVLAPQERAFRIVAAHISAKEKTAKAVWTDTTRFINDFRWANMNDETKEFLTGIKNQFSEFWEANGFETEEEIWRAFGSFESELEEWLIERYAPNGDEDIIDNIKSQVRIPQADKAWGETWQGFDPDSIAKRWDEVRVNNFPDEVLRKSDAMDIDITPGMTMRQLYEGVQSMVVEQETPVKALVMPHYQVYLQERGAAAGVADTQLRGIAFNSKYDKDWRDRLLAFTRYEDRVSDRYREQPLGVPPSEQREIQKQFMAIAQSADDSVVSDFGQLWEMRYKRNYGELGWTPPEPLSPFEEDGSLRGTAWQPIIRAVIDGDSLLVRNELDSTEEHEIRLLGVRARDFGIDNDGAFEDRDRLWDRLQQALDDDDRIYLVRQPDIYGNVDIYGRELAFLWIGDNPFYFPEEMVPRLDPSGPKDSGPAPAPEGLIG